MTKTKDSTVEPAMIRIKQVRSKVSSPEKQRKILKGLGLRRMNQVVVRKDTPEIRGMVRKIPHLAVILEEHAAEAKG